MELNEILSTRSIFTHEILIKSYGVFLGGTVVSVVAGSSGGDSKKEINLISSVSPTIKTDELDTPSTRIVFTLISLLMTVICMRMLRSLRYRSEMFIDGDVDVIFDLVYDLIFSKCRMICRIFIHLAHIVLNSAIHLFF